MSSQFLSTFWFTAEDPILSEALCWVKDFIFHRQPKVTGPRVVCSYHQSVAKLKEVIHCWKVDVDNIDDEDPHDIQIIESEGEHAH
jgi:hypothetical protein